MTDTGMVLSRHFSAVFFQRTITKYHTRGTPQKALAWYWRGLSNFIFRHPRDWRGLTIVNSASGTLETREDSVISAVRTLHINFWYPVASQGLSHFSFLYPGNSVIQKDSDSRINDLSPDDSDSDSDNLCSLCVGFQVYSSGRYIPRT